jgi:very-short-patch-repair endonuclease
MGTPPRKLDEVLAELAGRQKGIVTRQQLLRAGFTPRVIQRRIASGGLIPIHPGVYLVGHRAVHPLAYETAAIFACRPRALLSTHTAGRLMALPNATSDDIHVTVVGRNRRPLTGVRVHSLSHLAPGELRRHRGLPITSPSLTLLDLAGALDPHVLVETLNEARVQRLVTDHQLRATLEAHPTRRGAKALRNLLATERGPRIVRSKAERIALRVLREHDLEPDESDHWIGPYRVDFLYRPERLVVEIDSYMFHATPKKFVDDRRRTAYLASRNFQVFPLTWDDLHAGKEAAMRRLRTTRARRRALLEGG